jgi:cell division transport system ATP-binding protein
MDTTPGPRPNERSATGTGPELGAAPRDEVIVRFDQVGMRYGRAPEFLKDLSFELRSGSFHFLTGESGAGKTSLLSLIYLANRPSRGLISLFGRDVATVPRDRRAALRRRIGVAYEDVRLLEHLDAFDNVALPLRLGGPIPRTAEEDVGELLDWFGLADRAHAMPATLSGGERKRLAVARAVVARPEIILADEPTAHVPAPMAQKIMKLLVHLAAQGATVLVATHDARLVMSLRQPVLHLEDGRLNYYPEVGG